MAKCAILFPHFQIFEFIPIIIYSEYIISPQLSCQHRCIVHVYIQRSTSLSAPQLLGQISLQTYHTLHIISHSLKSVKCFAQCCKQVLFYPLVNISRTTVYNATDQPESAKQLQSLRYRRLAMPVWLRVKSRLEMIQNREQSLGRSSLSRR